MEDRILGRVFLSDEEFRFVIGTLKNRDVYLTKKIPILVGEQKDKAEVARDKARRIGRKLQELRRAVVSD